MQLADWELYINQLAREILSQQSPQKYASPSPLDRMRTHQTDLGECCVSRLLRAREMLYELLTNCVPATVILQTLVRDLMKMLDDELKHQVAYWAAFYVSPLPHRHRHSHAHLLVHAQEHRINLGSKEIYHLEAFVAKFMSLYKHYLVDMFL